MKKDGMKYILGLFLIIGLILLLFGLKMTYEKKQATKDYASTEGKFIGTVLYSDGSYRKNDTYALTYSYVVNGIEYRVTTDYGSGFVPKLGTERTVKYNPVNPREAVLNGMGANGLLLFLGIMFTVIPSIFIYILSFGSNKKSFEGNGLAAIFSLVFMTLNGAVYWSFCSGGSLSIKNAYDNAGLRVLFPIVFVAVSAFVLFSCFRSSINGSEEYENNDYEGKVSSIANKVVPYVSVISFVIKLIASAVAALFIITFLKKAPDNASRIALIIILLFDLVFLSVSLISCVKSTIWIIRSRIGLDPNGKAKNLEENLDKTDSIAGKTYTVFFLLVWFGFLIFFDIIAIREDSPGALFSSLIFWVAGIFVAKRKLKKQ